MSVIISSLVVPSYKSLDASISVFYLYRLKTNITAPKMSCQAFISFDIIENIRNAYLEFTSFLQ
ncbi:MAG: hypothetical protein EXR18_00050 [Flavobacteriaceae bacterium]|nr:hypothetical protein [Flavobacteriaceae bacterium]